MKIWKKNISKISFLMLFLIPLFSIADTNSSILNFNPDTLSGLLQSQLYTSDCLNGQLNDTQCQIYSQITSKLPADKKQQLDTKLNTALQIRTLTQSVQSQGAATSSTQTPTPLPGVSNFGTGASPSQNPLSSLLSGLGGGGSGAGGGGSSGNGGSSGSGSGSAGSGSGRSSSSPDAPNVPMVPYTGPMTETDQEIKDFLAGIDGTKADCSNSGTNGSVSGRTAAGHNIDPRIGIDLGCICTALGGKLKNVGFDNGKGECHGGDQHGCGKAVDIFVNNYGDRKKDAMTMVMFMALGYNVGTYNGAVGSFHVDREFVPNWKSWSQVGGGGGSPYIPQMRDALKAMGYDQNQALSPNTLRVGGMTRVQIMQKARDYVSKVGSDAMKKCLASSPSN